MDTPEILGRVALSKAGRDCGRVFAVVGIVDAEYVLLADGDVRKIQQPKKKKRKHIRVLPQPLGELADRLREQRPVENHELRAALLAHATWLRDAKNQTQKRRELLV